MGNRHQRGKSSHITIDLPNNKDSGELIHQASKIRKGIQKRVNWILRSMARALASSEGTSPESNPKIFFSTERTKNTTAIVPSAENDTRGRRIRPNHLMSASQSDVRVLHLNTHSSPIFRSSRITSMLSTRNSAVTAIKPIQMPSIMEQTQELTIGCFSASSRSSSWSAAGAEGCRVPALSSPGGLAMNIREARYLFNN